MKATPTTKEQLIYFMHTNISLGTYDKRFIDNLIVTYIAALRPITTNQSALLDKIVLRHDRQLSKLEINATEMLSLPWTLTPVPSLPEFTEAHCSIADNIIEVRSPFKKDFVKEIKDTELSLTWEPKTKVWSLPLSEVALKHFIDCLDKHYDPVRYCPQVTSIINTLADYESASCWNPTYKLVNGNYMIAGINSVLAEALQDIEMNVEPRTLAKLIAHGVAIDDDVASAACEELWNTDDALRMIDFAISSSPTFDANNLSSLARYIKEIGCDFVVIADTGLTGNVKYKQALAEELTKTNIKFSVIDKRSDTTSVDLSFANFPILVTTSLWSHPNQTLIKIKTGKTVYLANNKPIDIKK